MLKPFECKSIFSEAGVQWSWRATAEMQQSNKQERLFELICRTKFILFIMQDIIKIVE
jgi:hypothetical protein